MERMANSGLEQDFNDDKNKCIFLLANGFQTYPFLDTFRKIIVKNLTSIYNNSAVFSIETFDEIVTLLSR